MVALLFVWSNVPPLAAVYHRNVPADAYDADTDVAPAVQIVLPDTAGAVIPALIVAFTAVRADLHVPLVNST